MTVHGFINFTSTTNAPTPDNGLSRQIFDITAKLMAGMLALPTVTTTSTGTEYFNGPPHPDGANNASWKFNFPNADCPFRLTFHVVTSSVTPLVTPNTYRNGDSTWKTFGGLGLTVDMIDSTYVNYKWPRFRSVSGSLPNGELGLISTFYHAGGVPSNYNFSIICDENNFLFMTTFKSSSSSLTTSQIVEDLVWFGKYDQFSSSYALNTQLSVSCPYAMIAFSHLIGSPGNSYMWPNGTSLYGNSPVYGSITDNGYAMGGVAHPDPLKGVVGCNIDSLQNMFNSTDANNFHPNTLFGDNQFDALPPLLYMNENFPISGAMGLLGQIPFVKFVLGLGSGDQTPDKKFVIAGSTTLSNLSSSMLMVPWDGASTPFVAGNGTVF